MYYSPEILKGGGLASKSSLLMGNIAVGAFKLGGEVLFSCGIYPQHTHISIEDKIEVPLWTFFALLWQWFLGQEISLRKFRKTHMCLCSSFRRQKWVS